MEYFEKENKITHEPGEENKNAPNEVYTDVDDVEDATNIQNIQFEYFSQGKHMMEKELLNTVPSHEQSCSKLCAYGNEHGHHELNNQEPRTYNQDKEFENSNEAFSIANDYFEDICGIENNHQSPPGSYSKQKIDLEELDDTLIFEDNYDEYDGNQLEEHEPEDHQQIYNHIEPDEADIDEESLDEEWMIRANRYLAVFDDFHQHPGAYVVEIQIDDNLLEERSNWGSVHGSDSGYSGSVSGQSKVSEFSSASHELLQNEQGHFSFILPPDVAIEHYSRDQNENTTEIDQWLDAQVQNWIDTTEKFSDRIRDLVQRKRTFDEIESESETGVIDYCDSDIFATIKRARLEKNEVKCCLKGSQSDMVIHVYKKGIHDDHAIAGSCSDSIVYRR